MSSKDISTAVSGAFFGSALLLSGVYSPTIITSQLLLKDFHMLKVFLTASGSSAIFIYIARQTGISSSSSRKPANLNRLHQYDGNIIGGAIFGVGMALTGACPGTVLVQIATGVSSGLNVLVGSILGGVLWARFGHCVKASPLLTTNTKDLSCKKEEYTIYESAKIKESRAVLVYELVCLAMILGVSYFMPALDSQRLHPVLGGLLIGAAQAASLVLSGTTIGVSTAYERLGEYICRMAGLLSSEKSTPLSMRPAIFILGMLGGSWGLTRSLGLKILDESIQISAKRAVIGGVLMIIGARTAGGCTSGHGISGMASLSISSFLTVTAMFAGGIGVSMLL